MNLDLFPHNKAAYHAASRMLENEGKAAIVHPTGTGKSFIAFQLCADHPDKTVCWLSPSAYIFRTQMENLTAVTGGEQPENIHFFTYAKLLSMELEEMSEIRPDYVILDEFHRCGAEMWGQGVDRLLHMYPDAKLLGLSATSVRYLDGQRNMADELFDGNVANEMTLGEAIVRGANAILTERGLPAGLTLSDESGDFSGGLKLREGSVEVNCTVDTLLALSRNSLDAEIAAILFD